MEILVEHVGGRRVVASFKDYRITTDQPVKGGGEGTEPAPFDLFLASIATCAGYYVYDFCLSREIPTDGIGLLMRTERNRETKMLDKIVIEIQLSPDFPAKYEKAVVRAADLCTVKRHLVDPPAFEMYTTRSVTN